MYLYLFHLLFANFLVHSPPHCHVQSLIEVSYRNIIFIFVYLTLALAARFPKTVRSLNFIEDTLIEEEEIY